MISLHDGHRSLLRHKAEVINSSIDRNARYWTAVFLIGVLACYLTQDLRKKMWLDEFFTLYTARLPGSSEIVKAKMAGADGTPPLYPIVVSHVLPIVSHDALAIRLPSTLGFCGMLLGIIAFCRRRIPATFGFIAALLACTACPYFATEGRCYGMVLGLAAGALVFWQKAAESESRVLPATLLGLCLMLMTALNYFSIFFLLPLASGEVVRWRTSKKLDFAILGAMASAVLVLALHYPLIHAGRILVPHMIPTSIARLRQIPEFYGNYFSIIPLIVLLVGLIVMAIDSAPGGENEPRTAGLAAYEWVAMSVLALMPFVVITVAKYTIHIFMYRYVLWSVIGLAILASGVLWIFSRTKPLVGLAVLATLISILAGQQIRAFRQEPNLPSAEDINRALLAVPEGSGPIVIASTNIFMELSYYAEPRFRSRIVYPLSQNLDLQFRGYDTVFLIMSALHSRTQLQMTDLGVFLRDHPTFLAAVRPGDHWQRFLRAAGYKLTPLDSGSPPVLYRAEAPGTQ